MTSYRSHGSAAIASVGGAGAVSIALLNTPSWLLPAVSEQVHLALATAGVSHAAATLAGAGLTISHLALARYAASARSAPVQEKKCCAAKKN